jgi:DNA repair protein RecN (Recombination protein N)
MLKRIAIKNYALAEDLEAAFSSGLNIITGETGAGKSIIIDALGLLLGNRASKEIVRSGSPRAIIEGAWDLENSKHLKPVFEKYGLDYLDEIIIRREISVKGISRALINDAVVPLSVLSEVSQWLVDLHGQHHHQMLLNPDNHLRFFDDFVFGGKELAECSKAYENVLSARANFSETRKRVETLKQQKHLYIYEYEELSRANLQPGEMDTIQNELKLLENGEAVLRECSAIINRLDDSDFSILRQVGQLKGSLQNLANYNKDFTAYLDELDKAEILFSDMLTAIHQYSEEINFDEQEIERIRNRYLEIRTLEKKFNRSFDELLEYLEFLDTELQKSESVENELTEAEEKYASARKEFGKIAADLSGIRAGKKKEIEEKFVAELAELGMKDSRFLIKIRRREVTGGEAEIDGRFYSGTPAGIDQMEFYIAPNVGEEFKPLVKIASGGEISRIMLAIKKILAGTEKIPSLVFDEIDNGISGKVAASVGKAMKELAENHQIICITHLPQIAAFADHHYQVRKEKANNRTYTHIKKLNQEERIAEVASLIGGMEQSEEVIKTARKLIYNAG